MMNCNSKQHEGDCRDRLSELPDEILVHILSFLPIKDAVRTVLHRRFGDLWTLLPTLEFSYCASSRYIGNVMRHHKNPTIDMLSIRWFTPPFGEPINQYLEKWTNLSLRKKTKALILELAPEPNMFVPLRVFSNQGLVTLELFGLNIKLPRRVFMGSLRKLELSFAIISDGTFRKLISGCPCLQELILRYPEELEQLHFTAPSIESLELEFLVERDSPSEHRYYSLDCPNLKILKIDNVFIENLKVIDVSSVREANFTNCCASSVVDDDTIIEDYFEQLLKKFRNAQVFQMRYKTYLQLQPCGSVNWNFRGHRLESLAVRPGAHGSCVLSFCKLLRNSCYLRELEIYANVDFNCDCNMLLPELCSPCLMKNLTNVTIRDCMKPCQGLLQVIKFLLKNAVVLDEMVIFLQQGSTFFIGGAPIHFGAILSFPRASQNARVVIV